MASDIDLEATEKALGLLKPGHTVRVAIRHGEDVTVGLGQVHAIEGTFVDVETELEGLQLGSTPTLFCKGPDGLYVFPVSVVDRTSDQQWLRLAFVAPHRKLQRRQYLRAEGLSLAVKIRRDRAVLPKTSIGDVSGGGAKILCDTAVQSGDRVTLEFTLPGAKPIVVYTDGVVRRAADGEFGVEFVELAERVRESITSWVFSHQHRRKEQAPRRR